MAQGVAQRAAQQARHDARVAVRAAHGFVDDAVDQAQVLQARGDDGQRLGGLGRLVGAAPQDRGAAFGRDHRVGGVLQHQHRVAHGDRQRAARTAFTDDGDDHGHLQLGHGVQVVADGFGLAALLGADAGIGARGVDEGEHGNAELLGQAHQAQGLAVAFRTRHAEVARGALLGVAALLVADHHAGRAVEARQAAHDGLVVGVHAVAVQFVEVGEDFAHVVQRVGTLGVAGDQRRLPRRELGVDFLGQRLALLLQTSDLVGDVHRRIGLHIAQLLDLVLKLGERLFKFQKCIAHVVWFRRWATWIASVLDRRRFQTAPQIPGCHGTPGLPRQRDFASLEARDRLAAEIV
ncbi:Uncharacterised protein [Achromobacter sp. 2789STDY5608633]|nr:Uncharacterised protein [Achromobacter sp. 2789STDY5608633]